jgi:hypothetical protein
MIEGRRSRRPETIVEGGLTMSLLLLILVIIVLLAVIPTWPYSSGWGYFPSGIVGLILVILIILLLMGRL